MNTKIPFSPEQASTIAPHIDALFMYLVGITVFFSLLIFLFVSVFAIKYRRRSEHEVAQPVKISYVLEIVWTVIPFLISLTIFFWGAVLFYKQRTPPKDAHEIFVVGKQWMWKIQHPEGRREINALHVPVGRPIKLRMTSEDVIHSFFIPAFRSKMDVVPGRYSSQWFIPTKPGVYHIFCTQYCGTKHSEMVGWVTVMEPRDYEKWLASGNESDIPPRVSGAELFKKHRCDTCHNAVSGALGPKISFGARVKLSDGRSITASESYIRESILNPSAKVVAGYAPIMPTYQGQMSEEDILQIIEYLKYSDQTTIPDDSAQAASENQPESESSSKQAEVKA